VRRFHRKSPSCEYGKGNCVVLIDPRRRNIESYIIIITGIGCSLGGNSSYAVILNSRKISYKGSNTKTE
jgi:hypothetical protein